MWPVLALVPVVLGVIAASCAGTACWNGYKERESSRYTPPPYHYKRVQEQEEEEENADDEWDQV